MDTLGSKWSKRNLRKATFALERVADGLIGHYPFGEILMDCNEMFMFCFHHGVVWSSPVMTCVFMLLR